MSQKLSPYQEGVKAFKDMVHNTANPYEPTTDAYCQWMEGWFDERDRLID